VNTRFLKQEQFVVQVRVVHAS